MGAKKFSAWSVLSLGSLLLSPISTVGAYAKQDDLAYERSAEFGASHDIASLMGGQTPMGKSNKEEYTCNQDNDAIYTV